MDVFTQDSAQGLNKRAYELTIQSFNQRRHYPSEPMLRGLRTLQETVTTMLMGKAEDKYYLCSLDPHVIL